MLSLSEHYSDLYHPFLSTDIICLFCSHGNKNTIVLEVTFLVLQVLTNTIGQAFGEYKAERILEDELDDKLPFNKYFHIISSKLFDTNNNGQALTHSALSNISDTCWMLFESHCVNQRAFSKMLTQFFGDDLYLMWQVGEHR